MEGIFRVLLAEDDRDDREFFTNSLADDPAVRINAFEDGVTLMKYVNEEAIQELPDVIVLDQNMPRLNGLETLRLLRAHNSFCKVPVVIYSTYADLALREKALLDGAILVMDKPFQKAGYIEMIDRIREAVKEPGIRILGE